MKNNKVLLIAFFTLFISLTACNNGVDGRAVTANDVISAFVDAGLEAESPREMTKDDYGAAPYVCEGTRFLLPSLGADKGGRIFICEAQADLESLATYYNELGKSSALFFSWVFTKGQVLVQINGELDESIAKKYEQAIR